MSGRKRGRGFSAKSAVLFAGSLTLGGLLQACSNPGPKLLTQQDIPANLHVVPIVSGQTNDGGAPRHCGSVAESFFAPPGKELEPRPIGSGVVIDYVQVVTATYSCESVPDARKAFGEVFGEVTPLEGFGNQAVLIATVGRQGASGREYAVLWRVGTTVNFVGVEGPNGDQHITPSLAQLLAHRAVEELRR